MDTLIHLPIVMQMHPIIVFNWPIAMVTLQAIRLIQRLDVVTMINWTFVFSFAIMLIGNKLRQNENVKRKCMLRKRNRIENLRLMKKKNVVIVVVRWKSKLWIIEENIDDFWERYGNIRNQVFISNWQCPLMLSLSKVLHYEQLGVWIHQINWVYNSKIPTHFTSTFLFVTKCVWQQQGAK